MRLKVNGRVGYILMLYELYIHRNSIDYVWIVGMNKDMLKQLDIEVFDNHMIHLALWTYKILRRDFEAYLETNKFPELVIRLGN